MLHSVVCSLHCPEMALNDAMQKKRNNYKLLVDPELKKGTKKVYRLNGKDVPGVSLWCALFRNTILASQLSFTN